MKRSVSRLTTPGMQLAAYDRMLIRRCVWHREYRGYPMLYGVASWRGWRPRFSDGLCRRCARTARAQWDIPIAERPRRRWVPVDALTISTSVLLLLVVTSSLDDRDAVRLLSHDATTAPPAVTREAESAAPPATSGMASPAMTPSAPGPVRPVAPRPALGATKAVMDLGRPLTVRPLREVPVTRWTTGETAVGRAARARPLDGRSVVRQDDGAGRSHARASAQHDDFAEHQGLTQAP